MRTELDYKPKISREEWLMQRQYVPARPKKRLSRREIVTPLVTVIAAAGVAGISRNKPSPYSKGVIIEALAQPKTQATTHHETESSTSTTSTRKDTKIRGTLDIPLPPVQEKQAQNGVFPQPSALAESNIPHDYLKIYMQTGKQFKIDWSILAGIGEEESNHGQDQSVGVHYKYNCAGAAGPMQMGVGVGDKGCGDAGNAWGEYGDGVPDHVYLPQYAIPAAARLLIADGLRSDVYSAIFHYNHADWYVRAVLSFAKTYRK